MDAVTQSLYFTGPRDLVIREEPLQAENAEISYGVTVAAAADIVHRKVLVLAMDEVPPRLWQRIELERGVALFFDLEGALDVQIDSARLVGPAVGVDGTCSREAPPSRL